MANHFFRKTVLGSNNLVVDFPSCTDSIPPMFSSEKQLINHDPYKIFVGSWNVGGVEPPEDLDMEDWLLTEENPAHIYVLGFQEIVPLNAGNILASENRSISTKWNSLIETTLNSKKEFQCITSKQMVGIFLSVWVSSDISRYIEHTSVSSVGCGVMGYLGNKGSVSVRFLLHQTSLCFVCSHLASGGKEGDQKNRNSNAAGIMSRTRFPSGPSHNLPQKILQHEIYMADATTRSLVEKEDWIPLLQNDQLKEELMEGHVFQGWQEGVINFAPTYKYYPNSKDYYGCHQSRKGEKSRSPAWCDRIIWFGNGLKQNIYGRSESKLSDHRPVRAIFTAEKKSS
ncbi:hypothetical protein ACFE04_022608 [Oxalis oulophora]